LFLRVAYLAEGFAVMVTIEEYQAFCAHWAENGETFTWLVYNSAMVGVSQADIAAEFEFAASSVSRWATGQAVPHKRIQRLIVDHLHKKASQLARAGQAARQPKFAHA